ncbi:MAG: hypothetical protein KKE17_05240 [Proteobacteria bacterium]|nr:hypothetical protein [Pseudomonadota bacterium]MBU1709394.1 hypothetical protein [Pseudomonadota bacterium]
MTIQRQVITDNSALRSSYTTLKKDDVFIGRLRLARTEEHILLDLVDRGIIVFPSAKAQQASRSKTFQTLLLSEYMLPHTRAVHDIHGLINCMNHYCRENIGPVITKLDRTNAGTGILWWNSIEEVYSQASLGVLPYPFVLQPFEPESSDIRVIVLADYIEAYSRKNPHNFRNNLHCGGSSLPCDLSDSQWDLCRLAMLKGKFPYAHIDLMVTKNGISYIAEINLRGGIRGARINADEYRQKIQKIHDLEAEKYLVG